MTMEILTEDSKEQVENPSEGIKFKKKGLIKKNIRNVTNKVSQSIDTGAKLR